MRQRDRATAYLLRQRLLGQISRNLGISKQATAKWTRVPAHRVLAVSRLTGLTPHWIRPDIYPVQYIGSNYKQESEK